MRTKRVVRPYTQKEIDEICTLYYEENMPAKDVAELVGRTTSGVKQVVMKHRNEYINDDAQVIKQPAKPSEQKPKELTPREMIKKLYDMGYRIENNQLVCYQKVQVKLQDIING